MKFDDPLVATTGAHITVGDQKKQRLDHVKFSTGEGSRVSLILCAANGQNVTVEMSRKLFTDDFYFWLDHRVTDQVRRRHARRDARAQRKYELDCWREIADAVVG